MAGRKRTPEQEINHLRIRGEITKQEANKRLRKLARQQVAKKPEKQEAKRALTTKRRRAKRPILRKILDFFRS